MTNTLTALTHSPATVDSLLEAMLTTWNRHDMEGIAELFTEDADFVNVLGMRFRSRNEIGTAHRELHRERFAHTEIRQLDSSVAYLNEDLAVAHVRWEMAGDLATNGKLRRGTMTHVVVRKGGRWYFRATQNTDIVYVPELARHPFWSQYF